MLEYLSLLPEYIIPHKLAAYVSRKIANSNISWLKNLLIKHFIKKHHISLNKLVHSDIHHYKNFNEFFIRQIKKSEMGHSGINEIASPAESIITQWGTIKNDTMLQTKGIYFNLANLLQADIAANFIDGEYIILSLQPNQYHRFHMPIDAILKSTIYIPGNSYELDFTSQRLIKNIFCKNERLVTIFDTPIGMLSIVLVGAFYTGGIQTCWMQKPIKSKKIVMDKFNINLNKNQEFGFFKYGSGIIVLFEKNRISWKKDIKHRKKIKVLSPIAIF